MIQVLPIMTAAERMMSREYEEVLLVRVVVGLLATHNLLRTIVLINTYSACCLLYRDCCQVLSLSPVASYILQMRGLHYWPNCIRNLLRFSRAWRTNCQYSEKLSGRSEPMLIPSGLGKLQKVRRLITNLGVSIPPKFI